MSKVLQMDYKEIMEGRRAGIPENLMGKMIQGYGLTEREKNVVNEHGKVYVVGHTKEKGTIMIKPQLRDIPKGKKEEIVALIKEWNYGKYPKSKREWEELLEKTRDAIGSGYWYYQKDKLNELKKIRSHALEMVER